MVLYVDATTDTVDLLIDFIEVQLKSGEVVSLNWDESGIDRTENGFSAKYKGVCFDEEYANGRIKELEGMRITEVQLHSDSNEDGDFNISIDAMEFCDDEQILSFSDVYSLRRDKK